MALCELENLSFFRLRCQFGASVIVVYCEFRELTRRVDAFLLRRTSELNARYLPPLTKFVVFCPPSELQVLNMPRKPTPYYVFAFPM